MRLLTCKVQNFCSYKNLEFDFRKLGLTLIYGPTGSGKSTLQDIPAWILFGVTAKGGAVDEVISWQSDGEPTIGEITMSLADAAKLKITRIRGKAKDNDLYWQFTSGGEKHRGKDLSDTQKQINGWLGTDASIYCAASYFNEASDTNNFFLAKAKDRREVFERIADLELPKKLAERSSEEKKLTKQQLTELNNKKFHLEGKLEQLKTMLVSFELNKDEWHQSQIHTIKRLEEKSKNFDAQKEAKIEALELKAYKFYGEKRKKLETLVDKLDELHQSTENMEILENKRQAFLKKTKPVCLSCKRPIENEDLVYLEQKIASNKEVLREIALLNEKVHECQKIKNPYDEAVNQAKAETNRYLEQIDALPKTNPFDVHMTQTEEKIKAAANLLSAHSADIASAEMRYSALDRLQSLSAELRGVLLQQTVKQIEDKTNKYLCEHFDSEFKVQFLLESADSVEVKIYKNSYNCAYTQLSKGQRQLLRLCFSIAVMQATQDNTVIYSNVICFDEALDGLDSDLKVKAFTLFEELAQGYETILLIDHNPEFQALFSNRFHVELDGDESRVSHE